MKRYSYANAKRHAINRLDERYDVKNPQGLLKILKKEILSGNFRVIAQTSDGNQTGYVNYQRTVYRVVYESKKKRIITVLPQESHYISEETNPGLSILPDPHYMKPINSRKPEKTTNKIPTFRQIKRSFFGGKNL